MLAFSSAKPTFRHSGLIFLSLKKCIIVQVKHYHAEWTYIIMRSKTIIHAQKRDKANNQDTKPYVDTVIVASMLQRPVFSSMQ